MNTKMVIDEEIAEVLEFTSYRERVDFQEIIGEYLKLDKHGKIMGRKETTHGIIHHLKKGVYVVPCDPFPEIDDTIVNEQATGILKTVNIKNLRGVIVYWTKEINTLNIFYYFNANPTEEDLEKASTTTTYILCSLPVLNLNEMFLKLEHSFFLPKSDFWVYLKEKTD